MGGGWGAASELLAPCRAGGNLSNHQILGSPQSSCHLLLYARASQQLSRFIYSRELTEAAESGTLDADLWQLVCDVLAMTSDNTQDIEGLNSIISQFAQ